MKINPEQLYSIKEACSILNIHPRKLNRIAVKENIKKLDNRYLFSGNFLIEHFNLTEFDNVSKGVEELSKSVKQREDELLEKDKEISLLKDQLQELEKDIKVLNNTIDFKEDEIIELHNSVNSLKEEKERGVSFSEEQLIEGLEELSDKQVFLLDENEQQQFIDISNSQKELTKDLEIRNREFGMLEESKEHYKSQADYFMKANDKLSTMLQKITDTLKESVDNTRRQQTLNAKDKDII